MELLNGKKKISIIGAGNAACITAMHFYLHGRDMFDITIYYDPDSPIERVGQGSGVDIPGLFFNVFGINWFNQDSFIRATKKDGILYENWGKKSDKIFHAFPLNHQSFHYVPELFSKLIINSGFFEVVEKKIDDPEKEIDSDFIFDCRGRHDRNPELYERLINPLNSVILSRSDNPDPSLTYTKSVATPDGWTFVIPNHDGVSYGYLFNKEITHKENAEKNMKDLFGVEPDTNFIFENYIAKNCFHGERTFLNGNRLSFLEPLEATSSSFYLDVARCAWDHIVLGHDKEMCNERIRKEMKRIETFILWHYQNGSKYDTPFWEYAKSLQFTPDEDFLNAVNISSSHDRITLSFIPQSYSQWSLSSFKTWGENIK